MKVLLIGATGLLAKPVAQVLKEHGHALRLFSRSISKENAPEGMEVFAGDIFNENDLQKAMKDCEAIHISISRTSESGAMERIINQAKANKIKVISYMSGNTVTEENMWFPMMEDKINAEKMLINSGIPYLIFRATWFYDSLPLMIRGNKASVIGNQPHPYHFLSADDLGNMVVKGYANEKAWNKIHYTLGPEAMTIKEALTKYCKVLRPDIKKVTTTPTGLLKFIGFISRNKTLRTVAAMFDYFSKNPERPAIGHEDKLIGKAETTMDAWLAAQKKTNLKSMES